MKLYKVMYDEDGRTVKGDGITQTQLMSTTLFIAASSMEQVWEFTKDIREDPEKEFKSISVVVESVGCCDE